MKSLCETLFIRLEHRAFNLHHPVIASEARQSSVAWLDSGLPRRFAPRNDDPYIQYVAIDYRFCRTETLCAFVPSCETKLGRNYRGQSIASRCLRLS